MSKYQVSVIMTVDATSPVLAKVKALSLYDRNEFITSINIINIAKEKDDANVSSE